MHPFALLQRLRRGGQVVRYHTHGKSLVSPPTNAEHQWNVAALCWQIDPELDARTLMTALFHDIAEYDTGDSPAFVKRANPAFRAELVAAETRALERMGLGWVEAGDDEMHILIKVADYLDNVLTALDERRRGNTYVDTIFHRGTNVARSKIDEARAAGHEWADRAAGLLSFAQVEYRCLAGAERYEADRARVLAGQDYFALMGDPQHG